MARLLGPDPNTRTVWRLSGDYFKTAGGGAAVFYSDALGSTLADIRYYDPQNPTTPGGAVPGSTLTVDYKSEYPKFWYPDNIDVLWVSVDNGPLAEVHADLDARMDALATAVAAAETPAGAQSKADAAAAAAQTAAVGSAAGLAIVFGS